MATAEIADLRAMVRLFDNCNETWNRRWSIEELVKLYEAYHACEWDVTPDKWPENVLKHVLEYGPGEVFDEMCDAAFADEEWLSVERKNS